jgi:hypothetical protein
MSTLSRIVLHLARNPDAGFPEGDVKRGYTIVAPLTSEGLIDVEAWRNARAQCTVVRFSPMDDENADGWLTHNGTQWRFHFDEDDEGPDEPLHRLGDHKLMIGEYVSVMGPDRSGLVYRVDRIDPV